MDTTKVELLYTEDGRRAERHITEVDGKRTIELHVEEERPKHLAQRIIEEVAPVVVKREIETVGPDGQVVSRKVESIAPPESQMQVRENLGIAQPMTTGDDCNCVATKEDIITALKAYAEATATYQVAPVANTTPAAPVKSMQQTVADNVDNAEQKKTMQTYLIMGLVVAAQIGLIGYLWYAWN